jgi:hypothetical protein
VSSGSWDWREELQLHFLQIPLKNKNGCKKLQVAESYCWPGALITLKIEFTFRENSPLYEPIIGEDDTPLRINFPIPSGSFIAIFYRYKRLIRVD